MQAQVPVPQHAASDDAPAGSRQPATPPPGYDSAAPKLQASPAQTRACRRSRLRSPFRRGPPSLPPIRTRRTRLCGCLQRHPKTFAGFPDPQDAFSRPARRQVQGHQVQVVWVRAARRHLRLPSDGQHGQLRDLGHSGAAGTGQNLVITPRYTRFGFDTETPIEEPRLGPSRRGSRWTSSTGTRPECSGRSRSAFASPGPTSGPFLSVRRRRCSWITTCSRTCSTTRARGAWCSCGNRSSRPLPDRPENLKFVGRRRATVLGHPVVRERRLGREPGSGIITTPGVARTFRRARLHRRTSGTPATTGTCRSPASCGS